MSVWQEGHQAGGRAAVALLVAVPCFLFGIATSASAGGGATASATTTFNFTGGEQIFQVPVGVTSLDVLVTGGKGGNGDGSTPGPGGFGATVTGKLAVTPGQTLFIEVGGTGPAMNEFDPPAFNGGGEGADAFRQGGGGGGASDIRTISRAAAGDTLGSRLIIAGGGGGGGGGNSVFGGAGGSAGQLGSGNGSDGDDSGGSGGEGGGGGSQTNGGFSWNCFCLVTGEKGGNASVGGSEGGGGGGGGKFGGGGASSENSGAGGGGAGSSSFAPTATNTSFSTDTAGVPLIRLTYNAGGGGNKSGLKFGKVKLNKQKGTATLPVTVPGSGDLTVGGKGVVKKRPGFSARLLARKIDAAGTYKLKVKAKGKRKAKLFDTGKVKVKAVVSFKPTSGDAVKNSKRIKLKKN